MGHGSRQVNELGWKVLGCRDLSRLAALWIGVESPNPPSVSQNLSAGLNPNLSLAPLGQTWAFWPLPHLYDWQHGKEKGFPCQSLEHLG